MCCCAGCSQSFSDYPEQDDTDPYINGKFTFKAATAFTESTKLLNGGQLKPYTGLFTIAGGEHIWGDSLVMYQGGRQYISALARDNGTFQAYERAAEFKNSDLITLFGNDYGTLSTTGTSIVLEGFWQTEFDVRSGLIRLVIPKTANLGKDTLHGRYSDLARDLNNLDRPFELVRQRAFRDLPATKDTFLIVANNGGGRNVDRQPYPENSLNLIRFSERVGANGVEIDVRLTKDGEPMLFHDEYMTSRLVNGEYAVGKFSNYTVNQLYALARLKDNSTIPTLRQALRVISDSTNYRFVWLDVKSSDVIPKIMAMADSTQNRRKGLQIFIGLADADIANAYMAQPADIRSRVQGLGEDLDIVKSMNLPAWGPRWTLGTMQQEVKDLRSQNKKVIFWTLDDPDFISLFLDERRDISGVLTNHVSLLAYLYYTRL